MIDRVSNTAFDALTKALIKGGHLANFSLTEREQMAAELVDAISPSLHKDLHERLDRQARAIEWIRTIAGGGDRLPSEWADPWRKRAEKTEAERDRLIAILAQVRNIGDPQDAHVAFIDEALKES